MNPITLSFTGFACLVTGLFFGLVYPDLRGYTLAILLVGIVSIAIGIALDFRRLSQTVGERTTMLRLSSSVRGVLFLGLIILLNALSVTHFQRFDLTGSAQFTLTSQTRDVISALGEKVEVVSYYSPDAPAIIDLYANNLLEEYMSHSDNLTVRNVDPTLRPDEARRDGVDEFGAKYGVSVVKGSAGQRMVYGVQIASEAEHAFTSAILEVTGQSQKTIYFVTGHGEHSIFGEYAEVRDTLRDNLFAVEEMDLLRLTDTIPEDAAAIVLAGPQQELASVERDKLSGYLRNSGSVLIMLDPEAPISVVDLTANHGLEVTRDYLIDPTSHVAPIKDNLLVPRSRNALELSQVFFPGSAAIKASSQYSGPGNPIPLAWTSPSSFLQRASDEYDLDDDRAQRTVGSYSIGALLKAGIDSEQGELQFKLGVIGDSDFATNANFLSANNAEFFLGIIDALVEDVEIVAIERKVVPVRRLILTREQARFIHISAIGLIPILLLLSTAMVWWRRR